MPKKVNDAYIVPKATKGVVKWQGNVQASEVVRLLAKHKPSR